MNAVIVEEREKLTKKALTADHPTWCPAVSSQCSEFSTRSESANCHTSIVALAGIGCSSRFPIS
jgi:2-oxoglutarate ferredoxin oxidoreductase subunit beta